MKINHLTSVVQSLVGNSRLNAPVLVVDSEDNVFPITSMEELDNLERKLSERGMMQKMVSRLSISGGHTMKKTIWRICSKVFGPVAKELNWCGRGEKRGIRKTNLGALLIGAAMKNPVLPSPTEAEAEKHIKDYLRLAPGRMLVILEGTPTEHECTHPIPLYAPRTIRYPASGMEFFTSRASSSSPEHELDKALTDQRLSVILTRHSKQMDIYELCFVFVKCTL
ncbi:uncharacterized protein [Chanodichthys erythropterus]|uniref:uncharacterized protein n=1 Tax=Chanodichthys erythropterus TaxID=933992 RepID=UPI00351F02D7